MPTKLNKSDLQFYPSERLTDNPDGGGLALGTPIQGTADELFNPISSIERVNGAFALRKVFAGVLRDDDEPLIGSFVALTRPPKDKSVSYLLTRADSFGEQRADVIKDIEAFCVPTTESLMTLLGTQTKNSKLISAYQRPTDPVPEVGDVFCLRQDLPFKEQFFKVAKIEASLRTFYDRSQNKDFERTVLTITTTNSLQDDFEGVPTADVGYVKANCRIFDTQVVDAGRYFGISTIRDDIVQNRQTIAVNHTTQKLVPTNQIETALTDLNAGSLSQSLIGSSAQIRTINQTTRRLYLGVAPKDLIINTSVGLLTDKAGTLYLNDTPMGVVDYTQGLVTLNTDMYVSTVNFVASASVKDYKHTDVIAVFDDFKTYTYQFIMPPVKGSTSVVYQSMGKKYTLTDDGTGKLKGVSIEHGTGNINFDTGSMTLSLGALPDMGSVILINWTTPVTSFDDSANSHKMTRTLPLGGQATAVSASLDGKTYRLNARGQLFVGDDVLAEVTDGKLSIFEPSKSFDINASFGQTISQIFDAAEKVDNTLVMQTDKAFMKGSLTVHYQVLGEHKSVRDDGKGNLIGTDGNRYGSVDYTQQSIKLNHTQSVMTKQPKFENVEI